ncbi:MAG TPA: ANTAR domain-containing protein [Alphaproteobacteria bacterium]|jgi:AmiR/NasT family two-component response regulator|nr:ANTAR domain-containing protein [Alphaproteobacteria bacterium]
MLPSLIDLRSLYISIVHPRDRDGDMLIRHLQRLGARPDHMWPPPERVDSKAELLLCLVDRETRSLAASLVEAEDVTVIGITDPSNPNTLQLLADLGPHGVLGRPIEPGAVLSCIAVARSNARFQRRLRTKIAKLEERLRTIRKVDQAKAILMARRHIDEPRAFAFLRELAMRRRVPIGVVASLVVESNEVLSEDLDS